MTSILLPKEFNISAVLSVEPSLTTNIFFGSNVCENIELIHALIVRSALKAGT